ncbi:hypothetical protein AB0E69_32810 [Kribbella sp. NPDC026611]|uniref:hypothetical protein n=1 Tax=Kribbella sp. NPDC026611 TaxID=3154911 RepID=UPI0033ED255F
MSRSITRDNLGAWLLKANPESGSPVARWIKQGGKVVESWCVVPGYRSELMTPEDKVVLWVSGNGRRVARGIWGLGRVIAPVDGNGHEVRVQLKLPLLAEPVPAEDLVAAGITDLEVQRIPQGSNPSWLSAEQLARLAPLLPPWPT